MRSLKSFLHASLGIAATVCIAACTSPVNQQADEINDSTTPLHLLKPDYKVPYGELTADEVKADLERVFNYCDANTPHRIIDKDGNEVTDLQSLPEGATVEKGAFRIGSYEWGITYQAFLDAAEATGEQKYKEYVLKQFRLLAQAVPAFQKRDGQKEDIEDAQMEQIIHPRALDDCGTMCTAMMKASKRAGEELAIAPIIDNYFNFVENGQYRLPDRTFARHRPQHNTVWLDDMYMGIPTIAYAGIYFDDPKYFDEAATMYKNFVKRMWVPEKKIYRHGYVEGLAQQPTYHWARANGWALLTTVELLDMLPENHPDREFILNQLREHVAGLCALQSSEGFWHQLLDRNDSYLETSATAIYCYAIAHAIRKGWLEGITYGGVAQLAWHAISTKITEDGKVVGTCVGTGMAFDPAFYYYRPVSAAAAHGYGPVIWAAAEMINLLGEWHPRTNDSGLHYYEQEQTNPAPLFYLTEDGQGEAVK
ncbi:MAG: glycoside hydrolase family 88 protein [Bacteroidaceae bacterium]|nr:glycoside hydrolase family 88 protein [Bacteroidaceae bacterium]